MVFLFVVVFHMISIYIYYITTNLETKKFRKDYIITNVKTGGIQTTSEHTEGKITNHLTVSTRNGSKGCTRI